jgi:hypothetical protein
MGGFPDVGWGAEKLICQATLELRWLVREPEPLEQDIARSLAHLRDDRALSKINRTIAP